MLVRWPQMSAHIITRCPTATLSHAGIDSASKVTPGPHALEKFGQALEDAGIQGQLLEVTDKRGVQHKRGPSKWQQRRYQMERNLTENEAKGNTDGAAKWLQKIYLYEHTDFAFDFGAAVADLGATGAASPMMSGGAAGAAAGGSALGAPSGAVLGAAGGSAHNAASSASGGVGADGVAVRQQQGCIRA